MKFIADIVLTFPGLPISLFGCFPDILYRVSCENFINYKFPGKPFVFLAAVAPHIAYT
jgi:hypothetical protein